MFEFIKMQYKLGKVTDVQLGLLVTKGRITQEQANEIMASL